MAVGAYLWGLREEAVRRGYRFDASRIDLPEPECAGVSLTVTEGQMDLERRHLQAKLAGRAPSSCPCPSGLRRTRSSGSSPATSSPGSGH